MEGGNTHPNNFGQSNGYWILEHTKECNDGHATKLIILRKITNNYNNQFGGETHVILITMGKLIDVGFSIL